MVARYFSVADFAGIFFSRTQEASGLSEHGDYGCQILHFGGDFYLDLVRCLGGTLRSHVSYHDSRAKAKTGEKKFAHTFIYF